MFALSFSKNVYVFSFLLISVIACKREVQPSPVAIEETRNARPSNPTPTVSPTVCNYEINEDSLVKAGWIKSFEDNFNTDLSKWNIWTGGAFNNELQHYQPENLSITNGVLSITAKAETVTGKTSPYDATPKTFNYTSGRIECKELVSANSTTPKVRMMARIKLPANYGMWSAFWSYGDPWPTQGEIDFVEARGQEPTKYQTNYFYGKTANRNVVRNAEGFITANDSLNKCYHVYEMIWEQDKLTSYLDGKVVEVKTSGGYISSLFGKSERITLNLAVGGDFFTNLDRSKIKPDVMFVDWVKVFTSK